MNCTHTHTTRLVHPDDLGTPGYITNVRPAAAVTQEKPKKFKKKSIRPLNLDICRSNSFFVWFEEQTRSVLYEPSNGSTRHIYNVILINLQVYGLFNATL